MGWLDTSQDARTQNVQVIGKGNIKDIDRIHERARWRKINATFWVLSIGFALFGFILYKGNFIGTSFYFFGLAILFLVILLFRYGFHKKLKPGPKKQKKNWERLSRVPNWIPRKMKRRRSNLIKGDHYFYKRVGNRFYRKRR